MALSRRTLASYGSLPPQQSSGQYLDANGNIIPDEGENPDQPMLSLPPKGSQPWQDPNAGGPPAPEPWNPWGGESPTEPPLIGGPTTSPVGQPPSPIEEPWWPTVDYPDPNLPDPNSQGPGQMWTPGGGYVDMPGEQANRRGLIYAPEGLPPAPPPFTGDPIDNWPQPMPPSGPGHTGPFGNPIPPQEFPGPDGSYDPQPVLTRPRIPVGPLDPGNIGREDPTLPPMESKPLTPLSSPLPGRSMGGGPDWREAVRHLKRRKIPYQQNRG